jgi:hypothetical protein
MYIKEILADSSKFTIETATEIVLKDKSLFKEMIELSLKEVPKYSQRATRVVFCCSQIDNELIKPYPDKIIYSLKKLKNDSVRSNLLKIFAEVILPEDEELLGELAEECFKFMNMSSERKGLKIYSMEILYKISDIYPELKQELNLNIEALLPYNKMGFQSRGRKILRKLEKDMKIKPVTFEVV